MQTHSARAHATHYQPSNNHTQFLMRIRLAMHWNSLRTCGPSSLLTKDLYYSCLDFVLKSLLQISWIYISFGLKAQRQVRIHSLVCFVLCGFAMSSSRNCIACICHSFCAQTTIYVVNVCCTQTTVNFTQLYPDLLHKKYSGPTTNIMITALGVLNKTCCGLFTLSISHEM